MSVRSCKVSSKQEASVGMGIFRISLSIVLVACSLSLQLQEVRGQQHFMNPMCGLSFSEIEAKIVHRRDATIGSAPFMAYLMRNNTLHCSGTIITQKYILTAAHCDEDGLTVRLGEYNATTNPDCVDMKCIPGHEDYSISVFGIHKDYAPLEATNDIALIKLTRNIKFNINTMPICLLLNPANVPNRRQWQAFGWEKTQREPSSSVLQTTMLDHYPNSHCAQMLNESLSNNQTCLGLQQSDTCFGDSGGPLVTKINLDGKARYLQLGIVSFGNELCRNPGVYIYVPNYIGWIQSVIRLLG